MARSLIGLVSLVVLGQLSPTAVAQEVELLDSPSTGFTYTFDDWAQVTSPTSVRLTDNTQPVPDAWGGAGLVFDNPVDFSTFANGRIEVGFQTEPLNLADAFTIELYDSSDSSGKWTFSAGLEPIGTPQTRVSPTTLSNPTTGVGDFQNLDLSQISRFQILGQFGSPEQFDMSFSSVKLSNTVGPPPPYEGFEPDAPWRAEAATRIEAIRKADLNIRVVDAAGNVLPNATITVKQQSHEFGFGSAVQARLLGNNPQANATYQQKLVELFNVATIENNLKWPAWAGDWGSSFTRAKAEEALSWLGSQEIEARGHVMVWPGAANLPNSLQSLVTADSLTPGQQAELRSRIAAHIADLGAFADGRIASWDVINEPRTNNDVMRLLDEGDDAMATWFQQARAAQPDAELYLNEFSILASAEGVGTSNQRLLESQVQALLDAGAPIHGVGLQGHFNEDDLTGPERLWQIVDIYADLGLNVQVTEFDFGTNDEQLQAAYMRDFLTAMFAHEGVSDVIQWGFWEDAHFDPRRALFRSDWSIKPNGQAYLDLVFDEWWTDEQAAANASGEATVRAFKGEHSVEATFGDESATSEAVLSDDGATITITIDLLSGDFNRDGTVDAADYTVWRDTLGQSVAIAGMGADADGDGQIGPGDYDVWQANFGAQLPATTAVPEPSTLALTALGVASLAKRNANRSK